MDSSGGTMGRGKWGDLKEGLNSEESDVKLMETNELSLANGDSHRILGPASSQVGNLNILSSPEVRRHSELVSDQLCLGEWEFETVEVEPFNSPIDSHRSAIVAPLWDPLWSAARLLQRERPFGRRDVNGSRSMGIV